MRDIMYTYVHWHASEHGSVGECACVQFTHSWKLRRRILHYSMCINQRLGQIALSSDLDLYENGDVQCISF